MKRGIDMRKNFNIARISAILLIFVLMFTMNGTHAQAANKTLKADKTSVSMYKGKTQEIKITYTKSGSVNIDSYDDNIVGCYFTDWDGDALPLRIKARALGSTTIVISNSANKEKVKIKVNVVVNKKSELKKLGNGIVEAHEMVAAQNTCEYFKVTGVYSGSWTRAYDNKKFAYMVTYDYEDDGELYEGKSYLTAKYKPNELLVMTGSINTNFTIDDIFVDPETNLPMDKKYKTVDEAISALKAEAQKRQDKQDEDYKKIFTFTGKSSKKFSSSDLKTIRKYDKDNYKAKAMSQQTVDK